MSGFSDIFSSSGTASSQSQLSEEGSTPPVASRPVETVPIREETQSPSSFNAASLLRASDSRNIEAQLDTSVNSELDAGERRAVLGSQGAELTTHSTFDPNRSRTQSQSSQVMTLDRQAPPVPPLVLDQNTAHINESPISHTGRSAPVGRSPPSPGRTEAHETRSNPLPGWAKFIRDSTYNILFPPDPDAQTQLGPTSFGPREITPPPNSARELGAQRPSELSSRNEQTNFRSAENLQTVDYGACYLGDAYEAFIADIRYNYRAGGSGSSEPQPHHAAPDESTASTHNISTQPGTRSSSTYRTDQSSSATPSASSGGPWWQNVPSFGPEVILNDRRNIFNFVDYLRNVHARSAPNGRSLTSSDSISEDRRTI